jgi:hypothetical protein
VLSNAAIGGLAGLGAAGLVSAGWHMLIGMGIGMIAGMGVSFLALHIFCPFFGAMEVMLPTMLPGMLSGMVLGMAATMQTLYLSQAAGIGAMIGIGAMLVVFMFNAKLQGEVG